MNRARILLASLFLCLAGCSEAPPSKSSPGDDNQGEAAGRESSHPSEPPYIHNKIRWQTASEDRIFGFYLVRGESEEGPFEDVNPRPVAGGGSSDEVRNYEVVDEKALPGRTYYYRIEALGYNNRRRSFSPIFPYHTPAS